MGVTNLVEHAKYRIAQELHFAIQSGDDAFLVALDRAGIRRFDLVIEIMKLWQRPGTPGRKKYDRMMQLLALVTLERSSGVKDRDPAIAAARATNTALDAELGDILRREP